MIISNVISNNIEAGAYNVYVIEQLIEAGVA